MSDAYLEMIQYPGTDRPTCEGILCPRCYRKHGDDPDYSEGVAYVAIDQGEIDERHCLGERTRCSGGCRIELADVDRIWRDARVERYLHRRSECRR